MAISSYRNLGFVCLISPLRGKDPRDQGVNQLIATLWCKYLSLIGNTAFASHAFYPLFLDDNNESQRLAGMRCGHSLLGRADTVLVDDRAGYSEGMRTDIQKVIEFGALGLGPTRVLSVSELGMPEDLEVYIDKIPVPIVFQKEKEEKKQQTVASIFKNVIG